ncbi:MAG: transglutaminase domain-containing protein, partial [Aeromonas sp.]|nr:transglutaminase domain-containing protein [Aeromonas sp.]
MSARGALSLLCLLISLPALGGQTSFTNSGGQLNVGWQDREGKAQQLSYRLEAGKLPPLIAYRPARMQEDVLQSLLQQAPLAFPEVQFSLVRPAMSLSIKSRNADKAREASQWVKPEQAKL